VNLTAGSANTVVPAYVTPPTNSSADVFASIVPTDTIDSLADVLATCVNAAGGASDPACSGSTGLFSYTGGSNSLAVGTNGVQGPVATNTADAALYIAHNPGLPAQSGFANSNVDAVWAIPPTAGAPFGPQLTAAPTDFTLALNFVGGGLGGNAVSNISNANFVTVDLNGNVWAVNKTEKSVTELSNLGAPLTPTTQLTGTTTISKGGILLPFGTPGRLDSDQNGNVWIADSTSCLFALSPSGTQLAGSPFTTACPSNNAAGVAVDANNNVWVSSPVPFVSSVSNPSGALRAGFPVTGGLTTPTKWLGPDEAGNMWLTESSNGDYISSTGTLSTPYSGTFGGGSSGISAAFGSSSGTLVLWVPQPSALDIQPVNAVSPFTVGSSFLPPTETNSAGEIRADGDDRFIWVNGVENLIPPNLTEYLPNQTQVSPSSTGYTGGTLFQQLDAPQGMAIDQSGNAWVVNQTNYAMLHKIGPYGTQYLGNGTNSSNLTEFVGFAGPTQPLDSLNAKNSTYGVKP